MFDPMLFVRRLSDHACTIYAFHGVLEQHTHAVRNYNRKHADRDEFRGLLQLLQQHGTPLTMDEVVAHCTNRTPFPSRSFAVTIDDGFENNASIAAPILVDLGIPATFYLTTGWVGTRERSWIDRIDACLECADPGTLHLPWESDAQHFTTVADRIALLDAIRAHVKSDPSADRDALIATVYEQCGVAEDATWSDPLDAKLSWEQVRVLAAHPLFTVGGHTHTHAMLAFCSPEEREVEIGTSVRLLREQAGVTARHYAYPEGLAHHYDDDVIARLKRYGVVCCPTAIDGTVTHEDDPFHLRRVLVMWRSVHSSAAAGM